MGKTLWVTGAHGFIGRHLALYAHSQGMSVHGLGHGHWNELERLHWGVQGWINGEIEHANLQQLLEQHGSPDVIYHLAGGSSVGLSIEQPLEDFHRTVDATARLLEWMRHACPQTRLVYISSAAVYGDGHEHPISESAPLRPYSPYGYHKLMAEELCESYVKWYGLPVTVVRFFSLFGPGLSKQLVWDVCVRLKKGLPLRLGGSGDERRDWLYIDDAVRLLIHLWRSTGACHAIYNGGTGKAMRVADVVKTIVRLWGAHVDVCFSGISRPGDPPYLVADVSRIREVGFRPEVGLEEGLARTVSWFREQHEV